MTVLVAKFRNKREAGIAASFIRNMKKQVRVVSGKNWDDLYFAELIDEGMKEKGSVPLARIRKRLLQ